MTVDSPLLPVLLVLLRCLGPMKLSRTGKTTKPLYMANRMTRKKIWKKIEKNDFLLDSLRVPKINSSALLLQAFFGAVGRNLSKFV